MPGFPLEALCCVEGSVAEARSCAPTASEELIALARNVTLHSCPEVSAREMGRIMVAMGGSGAALKQIKISVVLDLISDPRVVLQAVAGPGIGG